MNVVVFGAGQLVQMMYLSSAHLGVNVTAVDVKDGSVVHPVSKEKLGEKMEDAFENAHVITAEFEHVPEQLLAIADKTDKFKPNVTSILAGADRVREKHLLDKCQVNNAEYKIIRDISELDACIDALGDKIIFKASRDGYDGYGQWRIDSEDQLPDIKAAFASLDLQNVPIVAEKMIPFDREISIIGARDEQGQICCFDIAENLHHKGQLHISVAPATNVDQALHQQALDILTRIATELNYVGVLAVEMFQIGELLLVNEIAPRVHNSGHWTQNGAETDQFEQHIRAVLGFPLGDPTTTKITAMVNVIGCTSFSRDLISIPGCHLHWYGKEVRDKRKMGHINVTASSYQELGEKLTQLADYLPEEYFPKLKSEAHRLKTFA
ncbi:5-(carboxyamino)imidazole ribonucleotide synthase [Glaciecola sp. 1036]|uniref:5-(carboxyamino)imidazole ribonucleotide synthase n=1 Tax=Alteromonadaceae TaxID=72275 RepID=UPI003D001BF7